VTADAFDVFDASIPLAGTPVSRLPDAVTARREEMDRSGSTGGVLVADRRGPTGCSDSVRLDPRELEDVLASHVGVFWGAIGADPTDGARSVSEVRTAVANGFVAVHTVPHAFGLAPDHAAWYPTYAACCELDVPVLVELGVRRSQGRRVRSVGRPITLDAVACDFPSLKMIGIGPWPWTEEAISVAYKHEGVYLALGGDDPGGRDPSLRRFADSWGRGKVVFASSGDSFADALARVEALGLRPESRASCLTQTAAPLFDIDR
jgi:predicted TIM-barrel fold metal-dependent hydrolase